MANLDDLDYNSITEISTDEALELIRQIRLGRRIPIKKTKSSSKKAKKKPEISPEMAAELLNILGGN